MSRGRDTAEQPALFFQKIHPAEHRRPYPIAVQRVQQGFRAVVPAKTEVQVLSAGDGLFRLLRNRGRFRNGAWNGACFRLYRKLRARNRGRRGRRFRGRGGVRHGGRSPDRRRLWCGQRRGRGNRFRRGRRFRRLFLPLVFLIDAVELKGRRPDKRGVLDLKAFRPQPYQIAPVYLQNRIFQVKIPGNHRRRNIVPPVLADHAGGVGVVLPVYGILLVQFKLQSRPAAVQDHDPLAGVLNPGDIQLSLHHLIRENRSRDVEIIPVPERHGTVRQGQNAVLCRGEIQRRGVLFHRNRRQCLLIRREAADGSRFSRRRKRCQQEKHAERRRADSASHRLFTARRAARTVNDISNVRFHGK